MFPKLTLDKNSIKNNWKKQEDFDKVCEICKENSLDDGTPFYTCDDYFVNLGVFNETKKIKESLVEYGYCDTEDALIKYLEKFFKKDSKRYFLNIGLLSMDNEKYYKFGSYINKDGVDTEDDYWCWIDEHPEYSVQQQFDGYWITFSISEIE